MQAGGPSLNPRGRPKRGDALAERVRELVDPAEVIGFLKHVVTHPHARMMDRISAARELLSRGWGQPVQTTEIDAQISTPDELPPTWEKMTPTERERYLLGLGFAGPAS